MTKLIHLCIYCATDKRHLQYWCLRMSVNCNEKTSVAVHDMMLWHRWHSSLKTEIEKQLVCFIIRTVVNRFISPAGITYRLYIIHPFPEKNQTNVFRVSLLCLIAKFWNAVFQFRKNCKQTFPMKFRLNV